jgi:hypothetical protein
VTCSGGTAFASTTLTRKRSSGLYREMSRDAVALLLL